MRTTSRHPRGFTLVELMMVVAIIGVLASVAFPQLNRAVLRARAAERSTIMDALGQGVSDVISSRNGLPGGGTTWVGGDNPPGPPGPGTTRRLPSMTVAGWQGLPMVLQGSVYYTYSFVASDPLPAGSSVTLTVVAVGDLDGDGAPSVKTVNWSAKGYALYKSSEVPVAGMEDDLSPQHTY